MATSTTAGPMEWVLQHGLLARDCALMRGFDLGNLYARIESGVGPVSLTVRVSSLSELMDLAEAAGYELLTSQTYQAPPWGVSMCDVQLRRTL